MNYLFGVKPVIRDINKVLRDINNEIVVQREKSNLALGSPRTELLNSGFKFIRSGRN